MKEYLICYGMAIFGILCGLLMGVRISIAQAWYKEKREEC